VKARHWLLLGLLAALGIALAVQTVRVGRAQRSAWAADTTARNERARHDVTRRQLVRVDGQLVAVGSRLAEQSDVRRQLTADTSRLARALHQAQQGRASAFALATLLGDSLHRVTEGLAAAPNDSTIVATGTLEATDSAGIRVEATVTVTGAAALRPPPLPATWAWRVHRAPIALGVTFECRGRDAAVAIAGPSWAVFEISRAAQSAAVCNPPPSPWAFFTLRPPSVPWAATLLGIGGAVGYWLGSGR
jgi:hypothetical protein